MALLPACSLSQAGLDPGAATSPQQQALADGHVDRAEYEAGFRRFQNCMADAGVALLIQAPDGPVLRYSIPIEAVEDGTDEACYRDEFADVDTAWQVEHAYETESGRQVAACLEVHGLTGQGSYETDVAQLTSRNIDIATCLN